VSPGPPEDASQSVKAVCDPIVTALQISGRHASGVKYAVVEIVVPPLPVEDTILHGFKAPGTLQRCKDRHLDGIYLEFVEQFRSPFENRGVVVIESENNIGLHSYPESVQGANRLPIFSDPIKSLVNIFQISHREGFHTYENARTPGLGSQLHQFNILGNP